MKRGPINHWHVLGEQIRLRDGTYAWVEEENSDPKIRWAWHATKSGRNAFDVDGNAPTLEEAKRRVMDAVRSVRRTR